MKLILVLFTLIQLSHAYGQEQFIRYCEESQESGSPLGSHFRWLKYFFKNDDCSKIAGEISKLTSFQEFLNISTRPGNYNSWTDDFPYLYPKAKAGYSLITFGYEYGFYPDKVLRDLPIYGEFKNLTHLDYSLGSGDLCYILKSLPSVKVVTLSTTALFYYDNCLPSLPIEGVIINGILDSAALWNYKTKVIGIENLVGPLKNLKAFKNLRYLGISNDKNSRLRLGEDVDHFNNDLNSFQVFNQLTHFSMNINSLKDVSSIGLLKNLSYLSLSCIEDEQSVQISGCQTPYIQDLFFLKELQRLRYLNLSFNNISDISPIVSMPRLKYLKLRGNRIKTIPDLSSLKNLIYLDLSGNEIASLTNIDQIESLKFLNLSGNIIKDLAPLTGLQRLNFLNISSNPFQASLSSLNNLTELQALNISGGIEEGYTFTGTAQSNRYDFFATEFPLKDSRLFWETLYEDSFRLNPNTEKTCTPHPLFSELDLKKLKKLKMLSMRNNELTSLPDINEFNEIIFLDLQRNKISFIPPEARTPSLQALELSYNHFVNFPDLSNFPNLTRASFTSNDISNLQNLERLPQKLKGSSQGDYSSLVLQNNLITSLDPLKGTTFKFLDLNLFGNPISREECVGISSDSPIQFFCKGVDLNSFSIEQHEKLKCMINPN